MVEHTSCGPGAFDDTQRMSLGANQHVFWNIDSLLGALIIIRCRRSIAAVLSAVNRASKSHYGQQSNHIVISTPFGLYFLVVWHLVQALPRGDEHDGPPLVFDEDRLICTLELGGMSIIRLLGGLQRLTRT